MSTVKVDFKTEKEAYTMVFGDSYKTWKMQLQEYIWQLRNHKTPFSIGDIYLTQSKFVQNGLKWCTLDEYEKELEDDYMKRERAANRKLSGFNWVKINLPKSIEL